MKKLAMLISVLSITIYLSLWTWAVRWIDETDELKVLNLKNEQSLKLVRIVWKITPVLDVDKDAERLLKLVSFPVIERVNTYPENLLFSLQNGYSDMISYYDQYKDKMSDDMRNKFALKRLIFINRSLMNIRDAKFELSLNHLNDSSMSKKDQVSLASELLAYRLFSLKNDLDVDQWIETLQKNKNYADIQKLNYAISICLTKQYFDKNIKTYKANEVLDRINDQLNGKNADSLKHLIAQYIGDDLHIISAGQVGISDCGIKLAKIVERDEFWNANRYDFGDE